MLFAVDQSTLPLAKNGSLDGSMVTFAIDPGNVGNTKRAAVYGE